MSGIEQQTRAIESVLPRCLSEIMGTKTAQKWQIKNIHTHNIECLYKVSKKSRFLFRFYSL